MNTDAALRSGGASVLGNAPLAYDDAAYIHVAVRTRLTTFAGLVALLGNNSFLGHLPQNPPYPCLVFNQVYAQAFYDYQGRGDLSRTQFQFDLLSPDFNQLARIAEQLRLCWLGIDGTFAGVRIYGSRLISQQQEPYEPNAELQRLMLEFEMWHDNTSP